MWRVVRRMSCKEEVICKEQGSSGRGGVRLKRGCYKRMEVGSQEERGC
jgi:hypothetical protein